MLLQFASRTVHDPRNHGSWIFVAGVEFYVSTERIVFVADALKA